MALVEIEKDLELNGLIEKDAVAFERNFDAIRFIAVNHAKRITFRNFRTINWRPKTTDAKRVWKEAFEKAAKEAGHSLSEFNDPELDSLIDEINTNLFQAVTDDDVKDIPIIDSERKEVEVVESDKEKVKSVLNVVEKMMSKDFISNYIQKAVQLSEATCFDNFDKFLESTVEDIVTTMYEALEKADLSDTNIKVATHKFITDQKESIINVAKMVSGLADENIVEAPITDEEIIDMLSEEEQREAVKAEQHVDAEEAPKKKLAVTFDDIDETNRALETADKVFNMQSDAEIMDSVSSMLQKMNIPYQFGPIANLPGIYVQNPMGTVIPFCFLDNNSVYGNGVNLMFHPYGCSGQPANFIQYIPVPLYDTDSIISIFAAGGVIEEVYNKVFDKYGNEIVNPYYSRFLDHAGNLSVRNEQEFIEFNAVLANIVNFVDQFQLMVKFRLARFTNPTTFTLIADDKVNPAPYGESFYVDQQPSNNVGLKVVVKNGNFSVIGKDSKFNFKPFAKKRLEIKKAFVAKVQQEQTAEQQQQPQEQSVPETPKVEGEIVETTPMDNTTQYDTPTKNSPVQKTLLDKINRMFETQKA